MASTVQHGPVVRSGLTICSELVTILKESFKKETAELWQPSAREKADALYVKIYLSAHAAGKLNADHVMDGASFITFAMTSSPDVLEGAGLIAESGDHTWAGVRICRTIAILLQSVYSPETELTDKQAQVVAPILKPGQDGQPNFLQREYTKLIGYLTGAEMPMTVVKFSKNPENELHVKVPLKLLADDESAFRSWCATPWGEERSGQSKGGKKKKPKAKAKAASAPSASLEAVAPQAPTAKA